MSAQNSFSQSAGKQNRVRRINAIWFKFTVEQDKGGKQSARCNECAKNKRIPIPGVTLHVCDANGILRRLFLGLCEFNESHTGTAVRREVKKILVDYELSIKDVFKVATDGASNMANAFRDVCSGNEMFLCSENISSKIIFN
uniref:DUF4371 domain-containing protein n=1 Tax=Ditylenchus dipsaci TaxID=166011 RepID=A0A915EDR4_9BILA